MELCFAFELIDLNGSRTIIIFVFTEHPDH